MTTRKLKALKPHTYGTRRLKAGDEYEAPIREAVAHVVTRKAQFLKELPAPRPVNETTGAKAAEQTRPPEAKPPEPHAVGAMSMADDIEVLRMRASELGINVDGRWGVHRLQQEIAQATRV